MKKLFLLIPALVLSLITNAAVININTGTADALRKALNSASDGDIIEMAAGTYVESNENYIAFAGKHVTVRAAEGANVLIQPQVPITVSGGGCAHFENVKIDASRLTELASWYSHLMYSSDGADNNRLILDGCEVYGFNLNSSAIHCASNTGTDPQKLDAVTFNNCYFHNCTKSILFLENTNAVSVNISNSTFANIAQGATDSYWASNIFIKSSTASILVDHCTFYNVLAMTTDYGAIKVPDATDVVVSNCIFSMPDSYSGGRAVYNGHGEVNNCLTFNYSKDSGHEGIHSGPSRSACIFNQDPLFTDAANGDFHITDASPAYLVGPDNKSLGAKRWWPAAPQTDFATAYDLVGSKAGLVGNIRLNGNNNIEYYDNLVAGTAVWEIEATRACALKAVIDMETGSASGSIFQIKVYKENGDEVGTLDASYKEDDQDIEMSGSVSLPEAGIYTFKLFNNEEWSSAKVEKITLSYVGGATIDLSKTTPASLLANADAILSDDWIIDGGKITHDESKALTGWAKWNIACADDATYNVTVNISSDNGHLLRVEVFENEANPAIYTLNETETTHWSTGPLAVDLGSITLSERSYVIKVSNTQSSSHVEIASIDITYVGGAVVNIPTATVPLNDAILNGGATRDGEGLHFKNDQYVEWNIHATTQGLYTFAATCTSSNYSNLTIKVKQGASELFTYTPAYTYTGGKTISSPRWLLDEGDYTLQLINPTEGSGYVSALSATAEADVFILDENTEDDGSIAAAAGNTYTFLLKRSFEADRYYTICIPVGSWNDELKLAFGDDYELWKMTSATQSGDEIDLNFTQINGESFHAGWPYIIKPSVAVQNPIFYNKKEIKNSTYNNTQSFDAADFIGTFYKGKIDAGVNNLYLQNNDLYYSASNDTPIKGTRAWIHLKPAGGSAGVRAHIVMGGKVATDINLVNGELTNGVVKTIENGQLVIIRDGVRYNVMGIVIEK